jgi:TonB family protein
LPLLHRAAVQYPKNALAKHIEGTVALELTLSETGTVTDARVLSGPEELRGAALQSVLEWHYASDAQPKTQASIDFKLPVAEAMPGTLMAPPEDQAKLDRLFIQAPDSIKQKLEGHLPLREGDRITQSALNDLSSALKDVDEHLRVTIHPNADKTGSMIFIALNSPGPGEAPKRIRVGGNVESANLVQKVTPVYPPEAKANRIQGVVRFTVVIGKDGRVQSVTLVSGDPVLAQAAKDAVQQWVYKPTLLNGDPVEVMTQVDVNFTLSQ